MLLTARIGRVLCLGVFAIGCQQIAGIEDRTFEPAQTESALCKEYCDTVMEACTGTNAAYTTRETCLGVCARLPEGDPLEPAERNDVVCRLRQAQLARGTGEPSTHCQPAGPGGDGVCGSNCEAYCSLMQQSCPAEYAETDDCMAKCEGLRDDKSFDVVKHHEGDTLQCRLVHVSSATVTPASHCAHSRLYPTDWCADTTETAPTCQDFCQLSLAVCSGSFAQYESLEQCLAVCETLPLGTLADRTENTVGCRKYHTYSSLLDPANHCPHTGPGGDGHCGLDAEDGTTTGNCESYCTLLEEACSTEFGAAFTDRAACIADCSGKPAEFGATKDQGYSVSASAARTPLGCRLLHVSRALRDPATYCAAALGGGECAQ